MTEHMQQELKARYQDEGYIILRDVLDQALLAEVSVHVDWLLARHPNLRPEELSHLLITSDAFWVRLISDSRLLDIAEVFVGPNIALFASHYISKPPGDGRQVLWHQDGSYWPLDPMEVVTLFLAVDDTDAENGCLRVIPGTHKSSLLPTRERLDVPNVLASSLAEDAIDESQAVSCIMKAGDVEIHHPNIIHGSGPNTSSRRRCGLTIRYIPATTRIICDGIWPSAFLLRGNSAPGINSYHAWPDYTPENSIEFAGCADWNQKVERVNLNGGAI